MPTLRSLIENQPAPTTPGQQARTAQSQAAQADQDRDEGRGLQIDPGQITGAGAGLIRAGNAAGFNPSIEGGPKLTDLLGPLDLASGILNDNPKQIATGGLRTLGSAADLAGLSGAAGAIGAAVGPLSIGFALSDGLGVEDAAPLVSGVGSTLAAVPTVAGAVTGTSAAAASAAMPAVAAIGAAGTMVSIAAIPLAIGMMNMQAKEAARIKNQTEESADMRRGFNENVPTLRRSAEVARGLRDIDALPPEQQVAALQRSLRELEDGIATISPVFQALDTGLSGGERSRIKPIPDSQKHQIWDSLDPLLTDTLIGYVRAADALAQRGVQVAYTPGRNIAPVDIANQLAQKAGVPHADNAVYRDPDGLDDETAPGNIAERLNQYFTERNPDFQQTDLYRRAVELGMPSRPATLASADAAAMVARGVEQRGQADERGRVAQRLVEGIGYGNEVDQALAGTLSAADADAILRARGMAGAGAP